MFAHANVDRKHFPTIAAKMLSYVRCFRMNSAYRNTKNKYISSQLVLDLDAWFLAMLKSHELIEVSQPSLVNSRKYSENHYFKMFLLRKRQHNFTTIKPSKSSSELSGLKTHFSELPLFLLFVFFFFHLMVLQKLPKSQQCSTALSLWNADPGWWLNLSACMGNVWMHGDFTI